jgi:hypothetical protein
MNQWIERIQQFLPKARVGKIQGPIIDIDDNFEVYALLKSKKQILNLKKLKD